MLRAGLLRIRDPLASINAGSTCRADASQQREKEAGFGWKSEEMLGTIWQKKDAAKPARGSLDGAAHFCDGGACRVLDGVASLPAPLLTPLENLE